METDVEEAATAAQKRPKGRPKKGTVSAEAMLAKPFPQPPRATESGGIVPFVKFWEYRKSLPEEFLPRLSFYVNREWPKRNVLRNCTDTELEEIRQKKRTAPVKYVGQYPDINPDHWENELFRYHGEGDYKIYLNDTGVRGNPKLKSVNVCKTIVRLRDDEFPPLLDDHLADLDLEDPINKGYIQKLLAKGVVIPGYIQKEEQQDVSTNIAVETLAELAKKPASDNSIPAWFTEMMKQAEARHMQERQLDAERHERELQAITKRLEANENKPAPPTTVDQVIAMAKTIVPAPPADNGLVALLTQMLTNEKSARVEELKLADARLQAEKQNRIEELKLADARHTREMEAVNKRLEQQEARAAALETARLQQASTTPGKSAIQEAISLVKALQGATDQLAGDAPSGTGNPWVDLLADNLPKALDAIGGVVTAMKAPTAPISTMTNPLSAGAVPAVAQPQQQQQPQDTSEMGMLASAARQIKDPLLHALQNQVSGSRFGGWIIVNIGEQYYQMAIAEGEAGMLKFLQAAPEVWGSVIQFGAPKVQQFITEFLNGPAAVEQAALIRQMVAAQQPQPQQSVPQQPMAQSMPTPSAAAGTRPQQQQRPVVVDASPAVDQGGGRKIIRPDGSIVAAAKPNGSVDAV